MAAGVGGYWGGHREVAMPVLRWAETRLPLPFASQGSVDEFLNRRGAIYGGFSKLALLCR